MQEERFQAEFLAAAPRVFFGVGKTVASLDTDCVKFFRYYSIGIYWAGNTHNIFENSCSPACFHLTSKIITNKLTDRLIDLQTNGQTHPTKQLRNDNYNRRHAPVVVNV